MHERVKQEIVKVVKAYPDLQFGDQLNWILLPNYPLPPDRFNKKQSRLLFVLPSGYPNTGPDNFFVDADLRLKNGSAPPGFKPGAKSSTGHAPISDNWGWFSWHPISWRPAATIEAGDNLLTFLRSVNMCLRGEQMP